MPNKKGAKGTPNEKSRHGGYTVTRRVPAIKADPNGNREERRKYAKEARKKK